MNDARVILKKGKAGAALGGHPWIYDWMIDQIEDGLDDGAPVKVMAGEDRFIGHGLWNASGEIRVRLYSWDEERPFSKELIVARLSEAWALRVRLGMADPSGACRLLMGDAEGLSGLVVDRYADSLVAQVNASGLRSHLDAIVGALGAVASAKRVQIRMPQPLAQERGRTYVAHGSEPEAPVEIHLHGLRFAVDLRSEQKTGFYLDQTLNRVAASRYAPGLDVLDLYAHTGGFGIHCAAAGARSVISVDSSEAAIALARHNAALNGCKNMDAVVADAMAYLTENTRKFGMVVLDPPKFAAGSSSKEKALAMYHRVNQTALGALEKGGVFVTSSCSGRIDAHEWTSMLASAARRSGRFLKRLELRGASPDHPVSLHCRETEYLKCAIFIAD